MSDITHICTRMVNCYGKDYPLSTVKATAEEFIKACDGYCNGDTLAQYDAFVSATVKMRILVEQLRVVLGSNYIDLSLKVRLGRTLENLEGGVARGCEESVYTVCISGASGEIFVDNMHVGAENTIKAAVKAYRLYLEKYPKWGYPGVSAITVGTDAMGWIVKYSLEEVLRSVYTETCGE